MTSKKSRSKCAFLDGETPFTNPWNGWYFPRSSSGILLAFTAGKSESNRLNISIPLRWIHHQPQQETLGTIRVPDFGPGTRNAARLCDFPFHPRRVWGETRFVAGLGGLKHQCRWLVNPDSTIFYTYTPIFKIDLGLKLCPWCFVGTFHSKKNQPWKLDPAHPVARPCSGKRRWRRQRGRGTDAAGGAALTTGHLCLRRLGPWVREDPGFHKFGRFIKALWRVYDLLSPVFPSFQKSAGMIFCAGAVGTNGCNRI